jgi:shikimate kinase
MTAIGEQTLFLIGYRGTGKTTVARALADRLGVDWFDADDEVERLAGKTIAEIFADDGEPAFREIEAQVVQELSHRRKTVVALGGGAVLRDANRVAIRSNGIVVWLAASVDTIADRMAADKATGSRRPNLTAVGGRAEIETVLAAREPIYRECATFEVDTEGQTTEQVVDEIVGLLASHGHDK